MKKIILCAALFIYLIGAVGCSKKEVYITASDISANTMLVKRTGELQVAIMEDFSEPYYQLSELEEFVMKEINAYNLKVGSEEVKLDDIGLKDSKAVMILNYSKMAHYSEFNSVPAAYFGAGTENVALELPGRYINAKNGSYADKAEALKNGKNKVLVVYEPYDIIVDGKIRFYSENAAIREDGEGGYIITGSGDQTVVIYTPY